VSSFFRSPLPYLLIVFILIENEANTFNLSPNTSIKNFKEITQFDITVFKDIKSADITVFGLYLNMKLEDIVSEVNQHDFLYVEKDVFNENRLYLYDDKANNADNTLAYLILDENTLDLKEIVLYPNMAKYLIGNSKKLLTLEMINLNSDIVRYFTGMPAPRKKTIDITSLHMETYEYYYPNRNFVITKNKNEKKIQISFSLVSNSTN
jgi:hypothetical protein